MKLPFASKTKASFPTKAVCPVCKKGKVLEPHSFVVLSGGALLRAPDGKSASMSSSLMGFLDLSWHGAHDNGIGEYRNRDAVVPLAEDTADGQFEIYVCSTDCARAMFNQWVDELDRRRAHSKALSPKRSRRAV